MRQRSPLDGGVPHGKFIIHKTDNNTPSLNNTIYPRTMVLNPSTEPGPLQIFYQTDLNLPLNNQGKMSSQTAMGTRISINGNAEQTNSKSASKCYNPVVMHACTSPDSMYHCITHSTLIKVARIVRTCTHRIAMIASPEWAMPMRDRP